MWPIFVFGTGRCGSTHIQRLITLSTCCWVWGEHEGFLAPLLESVRCYETSPGLDHNVFRGGMRSDDQLILDMSLGSEHLSWLNRFKRNEFQSEVAALIDRFFRSRVPVGWAEWGFKEILYGLDNNAPYWLLRLFPNATAIFTFREPKITIESMIRTWSPELLNSTVNVDEFTQTYKERSRRWKVLMTYFIELKKNFPGRITFISSSKLKLPISDLLTVLGLPLNREIRDGLPITNVGFSNWPNWASDRLDELFALDEHEFEDLFVRACFESDADFAEQIDTDRSGSGRNHSMIVATMP
jgi:Sulfotransferase family